MSNNNDSESRGTTFILALVIVFLAGFIAGVLVVRYMPVGEKSGNQPASDKVSGDTALSECGVPAETTESNIRDGFLKEIGDDYIVIVTDADNSPDGERYRMDNMTRISGMEFDASGVFTGEETEADWSELKPADTKADATQISIAVSCDENKPDDCLATNVRIIKIMAANDN